MYPGVESLSGNVKMGLQMKMKRGELVGFNGCFGYDYHQDTKTITVPWNYQDKLDAINQVIMDATHDESKKKTFTGYIDEIWKEAIADSDKGVKTGKKPVKKEKK